MPSHSRSLTYASIEQQLVHLQGVTQNLQATISRARLAALPAAIQEDLSHLQDGLRQLRKKAEALEGERLRLGSVDEIETLLISSLNLDEVLTHIVDTTIRLTGAQRVFLMLADETGKMELRLARDWDEQTLAEQDTKSLAISRTVVNRVLEQRRPVLTTDAHEDPRFGNQESVSVNNLRSILCVPIEMKEQLIGVMYADNRVRAGLFTNKELDLVTSFASHAAVAVENARLFSSLRQSLEEVTALKNVLDNVFRSIHSAMIALDGEARIQLVNHAAQRLLGSSEASLVGQPFASAAPELAAWIAPHMDEVLSQDHQLLNEEARLVLPGQGALDLRLSISPMRDGQGASQGVTLTVDDLTETKRLRALRSLLERMVSPAIIQQLQPESLSLGGERAEISVLFADLRAFTQFAEQQSPEQLVRVLNCHLAAATEVILREGGTVDKFLGDAIMAWFNAPVAQPDHVLRAVRAALGIRKAVEELHASLPEEQHLWFGCGVHVGVAVIGLVGSEQRLEYTAIGDCVNTARRIQEKAAPGKLLVSVDTYARVAEHVEAAMIAPIHAKGKSSMLPVVEILGLRQEG